MYIGAATQRCRTHIRTNLLARFSKRVQPGVLTNVRTAFWQDQAGWGPRPTGPGGGPAAGAFAANGVCAGGQRWPRHRSIHRHPDVTLAYTVVQLLAGVVPERGIMLTDLRDGNPFNLAAAGRWVGSGAGWSSSRSADGPLPLVPHTVQCVEPCHGDPLTALLTCGPVLGISDCHSMLAQGPRICHRRVLPAPLWAACELPQSPLHSAKVSTSSCPASGRVCPAEMVRPARKPWRCRSRWAR